MTSLNVRFLSADPARHQAELILIPVFEAEVASGSHALASKLLADQAVLEGFSGKHAQSMSHYAGIGSARRLYFGLGDAGKLDARKLSSALLAAFAEAKQAKAQSLGLVIPDLAACKLSAYDFGRAVGEASGIADYVMNHKKTARGGHKPELRLGELSLLGEAASDSEYARGVAAGQVVARAVNMARDLVTEPPSDMTPAELARRAQELADQSNGAVVCRLYQEDELKRMGAGAFLAVSRGSDEKPVLIELSYEPKDADPEVLLALVGKSVTFDSGGYDMKPSAGMRTMKCDMAGGAATLAAMQAIAALALPVRVKVLMAATENLVNGKAYKPGDVLTSMAGLTIEVDNTDAEGRLTMADAIEHARRKGATHIVDVATLTGAIRAALGSVGAGAFGNTPEFTKQVIAAGAAGGELYWELPLWDELASANDSKIADIKNSGGDAGAGSITAAHFLKRFAGDTPWVHLDIAAVAFKQDQGTGWGVRTLVELVRSFASAS